MTHLPFKINCKMNHQCYSTLSEHFILGFHWIGTRKHYLELCVLGGRMRCANFEKPKLNLPLFGKQSKRALRQHKKIIHQKVEWD
ncbi:hypothetical protein TNIN_132951 [Trichonephila inaurata madagascariensis]|uniref:Uncharacterized protein n=1 Tax=Trichonephila inaurata madagascariensis TaxID=2747483 RepID=A0A8X6Y7W4_9ARAC|nr:hypothetical protein TNIN_132951 [Trichonephila inaurata madagascariensis]